MEGVDERMRTRRCVVTRMVVEGKDVGLVEIWHGDRFGKLTPTPLSRHVRQLTAVR